MNFSEKRLAEIERKIEALQRDKRKKITDPYFIFLDNAEFKKLLGISDNTAMAWRQQGRVRYSAVGRLIFYRLHDISEMMRKSEVRSPKSEDRRPKTEDRRPKTEDRSPKTEVGRKKSVKICEKICENPRDLREITPTHDQETH